MSGRLTTRWPKSSTATGKGPACERCGSDRSERYSNLRDQVVCTNARGCAERKRSKEG